MSLKVLVIDDNPSMTTLLCLMLKGYGVDAVSANNSEIGLQMARREKPGIILLDLMMPDINGWVLCKMIRSFSQAPIIVLSALDDPASITRAREAGATDFLIKPVIGDQVMACINKFGGSSQPPAK